MFAFLKKIIKAELSDDESSAFFEEGGAMWLLVGLGNFGDKYAKNRHNIGFMAIDAIHDRFYQDFSPFKKKFQGQISEGKIEGCKIILLKPETYMNLSGESVVKVAQFYKIPADHIVAYHDELDIPFMTLKIKKGGGNAGHNGLKSLQACLGTPDFWRIRMGIGRPQHAGDVSNFVLSDFSKSEIELVENFTNTLAQSVQMVVKDDLKGYEKSVQELSK